MWFFVQGIVYGMERGFFLFPAGSIPRTPSYTYCPRRFPHRRNLGNRCNALDLASKVVRQAFPLHPLCGAATPHRARGGGRWGDGMTAFMHVPPSPEYRHRVTVFSRTPYMHFYRHTVTTRRKKK